MNMIPIGTGQASRRTSSFTLRWDAASRTAAIGPDGLRRRSFGVTLQQGAIELLAERGLQESIDPIQHLRAYIAVVELVVEAFEFDKIDLLAS